ncbi:FAD/NAD(P)-binding protein [Streptomyces sp. NPDC013455]|uniref:FAD/NAD(P)-binding protein n=1 Tax=Streptomyces sp. NPDC013455 TaxID=3155605 RepID=UPI00340B2DA6
MTTAQADPTRPTSAGARPYRLALIGGGPRATYAVERLSATLGRLGGRGLQVRVFERTGDFGAGQAHSPGQTRTSYLNRIGCQVSFAADETVSGAGPLRPREERPTLHEWCRRRFEETGDPDFDLQPEDWPRRYVHGLALSDMFRAFAADLCRHPGAELHLHREEVVDVEPLDDGLRVVTASGAAYPADEVLLLTGHSHHDPRLSAQGARLAEAAVLGGAVHVPHPYPLDRVLGPDVAGPGAVVGLAGMGLTAMDAVLHLTEGRGGSFEEVPGRGLRYRPSGDEPAAIVAFSGSGLFTFARPDNRKPGDGSGDHPGTFLTREAVDLVRANSGRPYPTTDRVRAQLDFDRDVLPLVVLEMAHLYYTTLFGPGAALLLTQRAMPSYVAFLAGARPGGEDGLLPALEGAVAELTRTLGPVLRGEQALFEAQKAVVWPVREVLLHWVRTVYGAPAQYEVRGCLDRSLPPACVLEGRTSPSRLDTSLEGNRFDWHTAVRPVGPAGSAEKYRDELLRFMARDQAWARQGNLDNPHKAASDGVWRDLRSVISYAVDDAGVTAASQRTFLRRHTGHHNRLANGAAPEVMAKITALIEHGLLDAGTGPQARVRYDAGSGRTVVEGPHTGARRALDVVVEARMHPFDPRADVRPLYRNLLDRGLVRMWRNHARGDEDDFLPGGLELTADFSPLRADGSVESRLTVLGAPAEGARSFLLSALRPDADHYVMRDVLVWLEGFWARLARGGEIGRFPASSSESPVIECGQVER